MAVLRNIPILLFFIIIARPPTERSMALSAGQSDIDRHDDAPQL